MSDLLDYYSHIYDDLNKKEKIEYVEELITYSKQELEHHDQLHKYYYYELIDLEIELKNLNK